MEKRGNVRKRIVSILVITLISAAIWSGIYFPMKFVADRILEDYIFQTTRSYFLWNEDLKTQYGWIKEVEPYGEDAVTAVNSRLGGVRCTAINTEGEQYHFQVTYTSENGKTVFSFSEIETSQEGEEGERND